MRYASCLLCSVALLLTFLSPSLADETDSDSIVEPYLIKGDLKAGESALRKHLENDPKDDQARFELGALQFLQAVERLGQQLYRYGAQPQQNSILLGGGATIPIFRLPVPENPQPTKIRYQDARAILHRLIDDLARADETLEQVESDEVKLPLRFGLIQLDLDGDGQASEQERLWRIYAGLMNRRAGQGADRDAQQFVIKLDKADVHWLRGYCHLISAFAETALAHDWRKLFERTGHLIFTHVDSPYEIMAVEEDFPVGRILDEVAMIHLVQLPVKEPARLKSALEHLKIVIEQSRLTWREIEKETDDDREWIPGAHQTGVIPGVRVTKEMVAAWLEFVDEAEAILQGKKLVPFWRGKLEGKGVNLNRLFTEPREFDLVLWLQGAGALPYLQEGEVSTPATWARFQQIFRGQFIGFVAWFN